MPTTFTRPSWLSWPPGERGAAPRSGGQVSPRLTAGSDPRSTAVLLWLLMLACAAFWGWTAWFGRWPWVPAPAQAAAAAAQPLPVLRSPEALARLLGAKATAPAAEPGPAQRFLVWGVIAAASGRGAALISVDGQAPKPFAVGAELAPGWVLHSLGRREARLAPSANAPVSVTLPLRVPEVPAPGAEGGVVPPGSPASPASPNSPAALPSGPQGTAPASPAPPAAPQQPVAAAPPPPVQQEPSEPPVGFRSSRGSPWLSNPP